jgi:predicted hydrolase (HD superfamily)
MGYDDTGSALRRWPTLGLLVEAFVAEGDPLVVGIDETLERRYGKKISAKGVYRDPVRSTHENFVKSTGLR